MKKVMADVAELTEGTSLQSYKFSYDSVRTPQPDYDETPEGIVWEHSGETSDPGRSVSLSDMARQIAVRIEDGDESYLTYFLDGSRHVYHVDDISYSDRVFPVIAGQVGVACCRREKRRMKVEGEPVSKIVLALPDLCNKSGSRMEMYLDRLRCKVNENESLKKTNIHFDDFIVYKTDSLAETNFQDRGIARIQDYMIDAEKGLVDTLVKAGKLKNRAWLVKDGSLEYMPMKNGLFGDITKFIDNYRWVIGVSKSFNPELCKIRIGKGKAKPNADAIINLPQFHRTPVARISIERIPGVSFAVWYIRLRDRKQTRTPFDGVIKVEKILVTDEEREHGLKTDTVDAISASLLNERNPTCYGADLRYANHLYPVYLTEAFVKSTYLSNETFINLF